MFELKSKILRLLKEDEEFRYAVAGLIGLEEILKRLEEHDRKFNEIMTRLKEHDKKFNEIMIRLSEHDRKFNEILKRLDEHSHRLEEHDKKFNEIMTRLSEHDRKFNEILKRLDEHSRRLEEHDRKFNEIMVEIRDMRKEIREIRAYMERTSLTLEEEAWEVLSSKLRKIGIDIKLSRLILPDLEINIYGTKNDLCIIGEASIRTGIGMIEYIDEKIEEIKRKYPEYLRKKIIKVIYTMWTTEDAIEEAKKRKIWLIRTLKELTTPIIQSID